ncbi:hypothetical protein [Adlercreutzia murintestinalis]|uniref:hypothetical protein n=1 Tax=Adlercreutzia murintestinalis TaxID=2941325 RepID=UPI00203E6E86|nr:hypothetical protein [Adlercreutzia murintestinalis]
MANRIKGAKLALVRGLHITAIALWTGGIAAAIALLLVFAGSGSSEVVAALCDAEAALDNFVIIPGAMIAILTACLFGSFTTWGYFKRRWIVLKWALSMLIIVSGSLLMIPCVDAIRDAVSQGAASTVASCGSYPLLVILLAAQMIICVVMVFVSVCKPRFGQDSNRDKSRTQSR